MLLRNNIAVEKVKAVRNKSKAAAKGADIVASGTYP
jgi:hypothetical protein